MLLRRFMALDNELKKPAVTDEEISFYCELDRPTMYVRLSKPCKCICLCGQLHNSIAEAKAHIIGKGCQYLLHWVRYSSNAHQYQIQSTCLNFCHHRLRKTKAGPGLFLPSNKKAWQEVAADCFYHCYVLASLEPSLDLYLHAGEIAQYVVDLVCKSIDAEGFCSQYEKEQPIHSQEHRQQHALYLQSKRARKLEKRERHDKVGSLNQQSYLQESVYVSDQESACTQAQSSQTDSPQHSCKKRKAAANAPPSFSVTCCLLDIYNSFEWMEMVKTIEEHLDVLLRAR